jgi:exodeoxyribonuclease-1
MNQPTFFWLDYETWGANPRVDRPAQFAGIRTDMELNPLADPVMVYARPTADFLPHPEAVLITGITPQKALASGLPEAEFFKRVHRELAQPKTCSVGYNSIRFDDEVTRFGFYRNFYDPYAYSWQNGNSRWDVLDLMRMTRALRPEGIEWPMNDEGVSSFRLTDLTAANNIQQQGAHDALVDVRATIEVTRLVKTRQPKLFDFYFDLRNKNRVAQLLNLRQPQILLHVSGMFPAIEGCLAPVFPLIEHPVNRNEIVCCNLRIDPRPMLNMSADEIRERLYTRSLDLAAGEQRLPLKGVHLNKSPALAPRSTLTSEMAQQWSIDWPTIEQHRDLILADKGFLERLREVYAAPRAHDTVDADSSLYDGFITPDDRRRCDELLQTDPQALADWPEDHFTDPRLRVLLFRYRARNFPETLNDDESLRWRRFCQGRLIDGGFGGSLTVEQFQQSLLTLAQQNQDERAPQLLAELSTYAQQLFA